MPAQGRQLLLPMPSRIQWYVNIDMVSSDKPKVKHITNTSSPWYNVKLINQNGGEYAVHRCQRLVRHKVTFFYFILYIVFTIGFPSKNNYFAIQNLQKIANQSNNFPISIE